MREASMAASIELDLRVGAVEHREVGLRDLGTDAVAGQNEDLQVQFLKSLTTKDTKDTKEIHNRIKSVAREN